jgi:hypothetical protein
MEKITFSFLKDNRLTNRARRVKAAMGMLSKVLIAIGCYRVASKRGVLENGIQMLLDMLLPTGFLAVSDMLFMELVATDLVMHCLVSLRIFNGFMQNDEDVHALLVVMGKEGLTGRGNLTPDSIKREIFSPLQSSKARMHGLLTDRYSTDNAQILNDAEDGVLRELNGLKKEKSSLLEQNSELKQRLEKMGLMKNGKFVEQDESALAPENESTDASEKPANVEDVHFSF